MQKIKKITKYILLALLVPLAASAQNTGLIPPPPRLLSGRVLVAISNLQTHCVESRTMRIELPEYTPPIQY